MSKAKGSVQGQAPIPPAEDRTKLRMMLTCLDCGTMRVWEVHEALRLLTTRATAQMMIATECEVCHRGIQVVLFWGKEGMGYSYTTPTLGQMVGAQDANGLHTPLRKEEE